MALGYDPFREYEQLVQQLLSGGRVPRSFPMDAYRRGEEFIVHLDLPGVDPGSIDVTVESGMLTVSAERRFEQEDEDEIIVKERPRYMAAHLRVQSRRPRRPADPHVRTAYDGLVGRAVRTSRPPPSRQGRGETP
jgi:hypothetical protein